MSWFDSAHHDKICKLSNSSVTLSGDEGRQNSSAIMREYNVYIVECSDGSYYTGLTNSVDVRLVEHNEGINKGYTYSRRPVRLVFCDSFSYVWDAIAAEKQIKKWSRAKKKALIEGDKDLLKELSECRNESHSKFK